MPNTLAARLSNWFFQSTIWFACTSCTLINPANVLSPRIAGVAARIERDFLRWNECDKCARVASHSENGVMDLMPIADGEHFAFKYVNGYPGNTRDCLLFAVPTS